MRKLFDEKMNEARYLFGDDIVFQTLWRYFNIKEDRKEEQERLKQEAQQKA